MVSARKDAAPPKGKGDLRSHVLLLIASAALPALLFGYTAIQSYRTLMSDAEGDVLHASTIVREHALEAFETQHAVLTRIDERIRGLTWAEIESSSDLRLDRQDYISAIDHIEALWLMAEDGKIITTENLSLSGKITALSREYFQAQKEADAGLYIGSLMRKEGSEQVGFPLSLRRTEPNGGSRDFLGVVALFVSSDYFRGFYAASWRDPGVRITLRRNDGQVLASYYSRGDAHQDDNLSASLSPSTDFLKAISSGADQGVYRLVSRVDGTERLIGFQQVSPYPLYASFGIPINDIRKKWAEGMLRLGGLAAVASLALMLITILVMRRRRAELVASEQDLSAALSQTQTVLSEMNHRVKNNLQLVASLLTIQGARFEDPLLRDHFAEAVGRVAAVGRVHERLYRGTSVERVRIDQYLCEFCADVADTIGADRIDLRIESVEAELAPDTVVGLGLIVNELLTNAAKHGRPGQRVRVSVALRKSSCNDLLLTVSDDGPGMPPDARSVGVGIGLGIVDAAVQKIDAALDVTTGPDGTLFTVTLPVIVPPGGGS